MKKHFDAIKERTCSAYRVIRADEKVSQSKSNALGRFSVALFSIPTTEKRVFTVKSSFYGYDKSHLFYIN